VVGLAALQVAAAVALQVVELAVGVQRIQQAGTSVAARWPDAPSLTERTTVVSASLLTQITAAVSVVVVVEVVEVEVVEVALAAVRLQVARNSAQFTFVITAIPSTRITVARTARTAGHDA
jgi:hypothetical protein